MGAERPTRREPTLLDDFLSKDTDRVLHAVWVVFRTRDPEVLAPLARARGRIERATDELDLGGALFSNRKNMDHALVRLELAASGTCLCAAYRDHLLYEPAVEEAARHVRIVEEIPQFFDGQPERPRRICECTACGRRFEVEEGDYHYPWWKWKSRGRPPT